jgi:putative ABC transport system permease protein
MFSIVGIYIMIGLITGIVPAMSASRFNPIELLQPQSRARPNGFRYVFTTIQFVVAIALMIGFVVIQKQIHFVKTKDLGFDSEYLLRVKPEGRLGNHASSIKDQLLDHSNILKVSLSGGSPFDIGGRASGTVTSNGREIRFEEISQLSVDKSFIETFKIPVIKGRNFKSSDKNACIINNKTYNKLGWKNLRNKTFIGRKVVGVISDIHYQDIHQSIGSLQLYFVSDFPYIYFMNIRVRGVNLRASLNHIKKVIKEFDPSARINYTFYDDIINRMLEKEEKQASAIRIFALIAFILSCLGLYGTAEFVSKHRVKEIGLRKVNGAKTKGILLLLNFDFIKWVAIAFVIAAPIAWYAMHRWLQNFAYKTDLSWWIFALAGVIALVIALLTVSWQSWRAARRNPVESLRYE